MATDGSVLISAPGKVILHGEHAVVYGKPALASSVDLRCYTLLVPSQSPNITLHLPDFDLCHQWSLSELELKEVKELTACVGVASSTAAVACHTFLYLLTNICEDKLSNGLEVTVVASLPAGAGLGSSAAYSVSLAAALLTYAQRISQPNTPATSLIELPSSLQDKLSERCNQPSGRVVVWGEKELKLINEWGFKAEGVIHGRPSGIDNSVSTFGGALCFKAGEITKLEMPKLQVLLINTNVPRSTKTLVAGVRERRDRFPTVIDPLLDAIENLVNTAMDIFNQLNKESRDSHVTTHYQRLNELFTVNHHLLNALGVGHVSLDRVCHLLAEFGLAAKLTGGGGGGCAIALLSADTSPERIAELIAALSAIGCESWSTEVGATV